MKLLLSLALILLVSCSTNTSTKEVEALLTVIEVSPNKWTGFTKQNLLQLNSIYDLNPILFSKKIYIESKVAPKALPNLTLNTRYAESPKKLLSALIHEEIFWWREKQRINFDQALKSLSTSYPKLSQKELELLLICHLEVNVLEHYLGKIEAHEVIRSKAKTDKAFPWFYNQVLTRGPLFTKLVLRYQISVVFDSKN